MSANRLQQELKKRRGFDSPHQEAILNILRTSDQFQNRFGRLLRDYALTPSQYNVLRILRGEGGPMPCQEIAQRMIQVVPAMTGLLDRLEAQTLVTRRRCSEDRRIIYVELTSEAERLLRLIDKPIGQLHHELIGHLTDTELIELSRLMVKARSGAEVAAE